MELLMPGLGLVFWMTVAFSIVLYILRKYAWGPILEVLYERERQMAKSVSDAKRIEHELAGLDEIKRVRMADAEQYGEELKSKARLEAEQIIELAREKAREEARLIAEKADELVASYKREALREIKGQLSSLSLDMAEKVIREEFSDRERNARYVGKLLDEVAVN